MVAEKVRSSRQLLVCEYNSTEDGTATVKFLGWKFISSMDIIKQQFDSVCATAIDGNIAYIRPIVLQGFRSCEKNIFTCTGTSTGVPQPLQQSSVINVSGHLQLDEGLFKSSYCLPLKCSTRVKKKAEHAASKYNRYYHKSSDKSERRRHHKRKQVSSSSSSSSSDIDIDSLNLDDDNDIDDGDDDHDAFFEKGIASLAEEADQEKRSSSSDLLTLAAAGVSKHMSNEGDQEQNASDEEFLNGNSSGVSLRGEEHEVNETEMKRMQEAMKTKKVALTSSVLC